MLNIHLRKQIRVLARFSNACGQKMNIMTPFFSSPEQNAQGNYCHTGLSVVRRVSCVVNFLLKWHLLLNGWANLNQISQKCSIHGPFSNLFKDSNSMQNSGYHGNQKEKLKKSSRHKL